MANVLVIDDNATIRDGVTTVVSRLNHTVFEASGGKVGVQLARSNPIDIVLTDLKMEGLDGMGVLSAIRAQDPEIPVVIMTAYGTIENAVEAIKRGAFDYIQKPFSPDTLRLKLVRGLEWRENFRRQARLQGTQEVLSGARDRPQRGEASNAFEGMLGQSPAMKKVFKIVERVAPGDSAVAINGASGTGKELVASAVHNLSTRAEGPLIKVNCGAIPENLLESELFGHERGAFTGAIKRKLGRFELADGGTIFLDEIGELPLNMQVKLLRVLQEKVIDRVGGERSVPVDVRVISATNKVLLDEVEAGNFREDLFYRLHVVPIQLPPLRERTEDIVPMAQHFVRTLGPRTNPLVTSLSTEAERCLLSYHYPGNVRELINIIEQALVFAEPPEIRTEDLPPQVSGYTNPSPTRHQPQRGSLNLTEFLEAVERQEILAAYEQSAGVKTETARRLGIKTSALYYKLEKYGIGSITSRADSETVQSPQTSEGPHKDG